MPEPRFVPYRPERLDEEEMRERARAFHAEMDARRSVRDFAPDPVPRELIEVLLDNDRGTSLGHGRPQ